MELHPPGAVAFDDAAVAVGDALPTRARTERVRERNYYDTFDRLLRSRGLQLAHEGGEFVLREGQGSGAVRARLKAARSRRPLLVSSLPAGALRDALSELIGVRALLLLARVRWRERRFDVLDDERKTVVRLVLSAPTIVGSDDAPLALAPRLDVQALRGYDQERSEVCRTMTDQLGFIPASEPLIDEAVRVGGGLPGGVSSKAVVTLEAEQPASSTVTTVLRAQLEIIEANLPGLLAEIDTEFLHDFRVAVRRSRAVQRECKEVFAPEALAHFRAEFRWLQQVTGDARDMDVYLLGFEELREMIAPGLRADLEPLHGVLRAHHRRAHAAMRRALGSSRATALPGSWRAFLVAPEAGTGGPAAQSAISDLAGERIRKVYRRMIRMGRAIDAESPAEDYHELRKKGKELRYLLELFGAPLYPGEVVRPLVKTLKGLQDVLGRHQDREVQAATLRSLQNEIAGVAGGAGALMAVGALIQSLGQDELAARSEFGERFAPFAARDQRKLVKETFR